MMKKIVFYVAIGLSLTFVSCSKEDGPMDDVQPDSDWIKVEGSARDIAIGSDANARVWIISTEKMWDNDFKIKYLNNNTWTTTEGGATRIASDQNGNAWVVNSAGEIYKYSFGSPGAKSVTTWSGVLGITAKELAISKNGMVWAVTTQAGTNGNGNEIKSFTPNTWSASLAEGNKVAADQLGNPYVINNSNDIWYSYNGGAWTQLAGVKAREIAYGANGQAWIITNEATTGGYKVKQANGAVWEDRKMGAVEITVDPNGKAWIVNDKNEIYRFK
jgi:hypothetical protein